MKKHLYLNISMWLHFRENMLLTLIDILEENVD